jgi:hypothetical protein
MGQLSGQDSCSNAVPAAFAGIVSVKFLAVTD